MSVRTSWRAAGFYPPVSLDDQCYFTGGFLPAARQDWRRTTDDERHLMDENDTIACPYCNEQIYEDALRCPHCENYLSEEEYSPTHPTWIYLTVLVCLIVVFLWIFSVQ